MTKGIAAKLSHEVIHKKITDEAIWVHCVLKVENICNDELHITTGRVWLEVVVPIPEELSEALKTKTFQLDEERTKDGFYSYGFHSYGEVIDFDFTRDAEFPQGRDVQPGEIEELEFDFFVPADYEVVGFFTFIQNPTIQEPRSWGWSKTTYHNLTTDNI